MKTTNKELHMLTPEQAAQVTHIGGSLNLNNYPHPLPSLTYVDWYLDLRGYPHPLPSLTHVGESLDLHDYPHPLPALTHITSYTYFTDFKQLKEILSISRDSDGDWEVTYTSTQVPQCAELRTWLAGYDFTDEVAVYKHLMEQKE